MMYKFEINKQVVCIRDDWMWITNTGYEPWGFPIKNGIYTIAWIGKWPESFPSLCEICLILHEFSQIYENGAYQAFDAECFRPVKDTSIEVFRSTLITPPRVKILENV
ncbi:MAG TPA: hypothetical protein VEP90_06190 [Methylomirabilota bacterium]|nr:hypothetical protein [Methylomirabilota bacterium]